MNHPRNLGAAWIAVLTVSAASFAVQAPQLTPQQAVPQQTPAQAPPAPTQAPATPPAPQPARSAETIVIDPGHGGSDAGARGSSGIIEKDYVMFIAVLLRDELQRQGLRATITRQQNENPSYDDRAALANAFARPIFITLHAASTGQAGTARAYFSRYLPAAPSDSPEASARLPRWEDAQNRYINDSQRLAQLVQSEFAGKFANSPKNASPAALRQLKSVTGPAIAVEISSVSVRDRAQLDKMAPSIVAAIARGIAQFRGTPAAAAPVPPQTSQPGTPQ